MDWINHGWIARLLDAGFVILVVTGVWRIFRAWIEAVDYRDKTIFEIRNTVNEIRDELRAMQRKVEGETRRALNEMGHRFAAICAPLDQ